MKKLESTLLNMVVVLTVVTVIAGGLLAYVNQVTSVQIEKINKEKLDAGIRKVIIGDKNEELGNITPSEVEVDGQKYKLYITEKGTAVESVVNGFGGALRVLVGFDDNGNVLGYEILETSETPGLGVKADTWFKAGGKGSIIGMNPGKKELKVSKDGGDVDAITASTITSRAFLKAVNNAHAAAFANDASASDTHSGASQQIVPQQPEKADKADSKKAEQPKDPAEKNESAPAADAHTGASPQHN